MYQVSIECFSSLIEENRKLVCSHIYAQSITEGYQYGDIYVDSISKPTCALLWHYCGFAYISGTPTTIFLDEVFELMSQNLSRRMILQIFDEEQDSYFGQKGLTRRERYCFEYPQMKSIDTPIYKQDFTICEPDISLLKLLKGKIIPSFSWNSNDEFLQKGKAYCIKHQNDYAAIAFSSAISNSEIDIGVETNEMYRHLGLASLAASFMVNYILSIHKSPIWECDSQNIGSCKTAEKIGFTINKKHPYFFQK